MTKEHLIQDIENVLAMVRSASGDPSLREPARQAVAGLYRHVQNDADVPGQVEGCLRESVDVLDRGREGLSDVGWNHIRACLEGALEFARA